MMVKSNEKKSQNNRRSMMKCRRIVNFEEIGTELPTGKNDEF